MRDIVSSIFESWINEKVSLYFDDYKYPSNKIEGLHHATLNPYLKTEADIQVKFSGFLEEALLPMGYTAHAEQTDIYAYKGKGYPQRPDLSIHKVNNKDGLWLFNNSNPI